MAKKKSTTPALASQPVSPDSEDYQAKDDFNQFVHTHEIMHDPKRMAGVHKVAGRHKKAISSLQDLKNAYDQKVASGEVTHGGSTMAEPKGEDMMMSAMGKSMMKKAKKATMGM